MESAISPTLSPPPSSPSSSSSSSTNLASCSLSKSTSTTSSSPATTPPTTTSPRACNVFRNSCRSSVTFQSTPFYASLVPISYLVNSQPTTASTTRIRRPSSSLRTSRPPTRSRGGVLAEILCHNARVEYVRLHGLDGQIDRESFKRTMPVITYEDLQLDVARIARARNLRSSALTPFRSSSPSTEHDGFLPGSGYFPSRRGPLFWVKWAKMGGSCFLSNVCRVFAKLGRFLIWCTAQGRPEERAS